MERRKELRWSDQRRAYWMDFAGCRWWLSVRLNSDGSYSLTQAEMALIVAAIHDGKLTVEKGTTDGERTRGQ